MNAAMHRPFQPLCRVAVLFALLCALGRITAVESAATASADAAAVDSAPADAAKAKLAAVRARIAELTNRMGSQLAQRDALSARVREAELVIAAQRQRVEELHAAQAVAERRRSDLRAEQTRNQNALQAERASLAAQARAAYMIGRQEELKLLLNQSNPASLGRTLTYYGYFARTAQPQDRSRSRMMRRGCSNWSRRSSSKRKNCRSLEDDATREIAGLQARARRTQRWRSRRSIKNWRAAIRNSAI